jgi:hypothetical protein
MRTLLFYVPSNLPMVELARFVRMFREADYCIGDVHVGKDVAEIVLKRQENANEKAASA